MGDSVAVESWHLPRALSNEALRLLSSLPMDEIERRLRMDGPAVPEGREPAAVEGQPSDGEVAELVAALRMDAECVAAEQPDLMQMTDKQLTRAADLLERRALRPIPVSERLPGPEDCGISAGGYFRCSCWCWNPPSSLGGIGWWSIEPLEWCEGATHWLPAHALPLPEVE